MTTSSSCKATNDDKSDNTDAHKRTTNLTNVVISPSVLRIVETISKRHAEIMAKLHSDGATNEANNASLGKELSELSSVTSLLHKLYSLQAEHDSMTQLYSEAHGEAELQQECLDEQSNLFQQITQVVDSLTNSVLRIRHSQQQHSENLDEEDAVLEIRAGTGGEEASLFAAELLATYERTSRAMGWKYEVLSDSRTDLGGLKEAAVTISGFVLQSNSNLGPYGFFRYESGVHRVQRIPVNDVRIQTSAASVAVLPAPSTTSNNDSSSFLPLNELKIETMRASGAGGQHVNTTESAVRITHIPTGITAAIQDERSQHKNKAKAMKLITARVRDKVRQEEAQQRGDVRNSLMGGGDRSERIRTYNYPQDRVTDHRCKHSEYGVTKLLEDGEFGLVSIFASYLRNMVKEELLQSIEEEYKEEEEEEKKNSKEKKTRKQR